MINGAFLEDWYQDFAPANLTACNIRTGERIQEVSLVAARVRHMERKEPYADRRTSMAVEQWLAAGRGAEEYENTPGVMVFSPLRDGQIAHYTAAVYLFKTILRQIRPKFPLPKPEFHIRVKERTTEVEERALIDMGIQAGALRVFLYREPVFSMSNNLRGTKGLGRGLRYRLNAERRRGAICQQ